jgi:hypothetical protein
MMLWREGFAYYQRATVLQKLLFVIGSFLCLVMAFHLIALVVTGGSLDGPVSLRKPATFAETGWLMCWSVGYFLPLLNLRQKDRIFIVVGVLLFAVGETLIASIQAWRGVPFHYNVSSFFDALLFYTGGLESVVFFTAMTLLFVSSWRRQTLAPSLLLSARVGTAFVLFGGLIGYLMIANSSGVWQGLERWRAHGVFDLYTNIEELLQERTGGNLVLLHAIGVHGLSLLPLAAWLLTYSALPENRRVHLIAWLSGLLVAIVLTLAVQTLRLKPLNELETVAGLLLSISSILFLSLYGFIARAALVNVRQPKAARA